MFTSCYCAICLFCIGEGRQANLSTRAACQAISCQEITCQVLSWYICYLFSLMVCLFGSVIFLKTCRKELFLLQKIFQSVRYTCSMKTITNLIFSRGRRKGFFHFKNFCYFWSVFFQLFNQFLLGLIIIYEHTHLRCLL